MDDWQRVLLLALLYSGVAFLFLRYARLAEKASWKLLQVAETAQPDAQAAATTSGRRLLPLLVYGVCCIVAMSFTSGHPLSMLADNGLLLLSATALLDGSILCAATAFAAFALMVSPFQGICVGVPVCWSAYKFMCTRQRSAGALSAGDLRQLRQISDNSVAQAAAASPAPTIIEQPRRTFRTSVIWFLSYSLLCAVFMLAAEIARSDLVWAGRLPAYLPALSAGVRQAESFAAAILMPLRQGRVFEAAVAALLHMRPACVDAASLHPELSLMWYVGSAAFSRHLPYYAAIFAGHALLYPLPATYRLRRRPDLALVLVAGLAALLDPTSRWSLARLPLVACMALSHSAVVAREWNAVAAACALGIARQG